MILRLTIAGILLASGCIKKQNLDSNLAHTEGDVPRFRTGPFETLSKIPCTAKTARACEYLNKLFGILTSKNPHIFKGEYDVSKFFVSIVDKKIVNAYAYPSYGHTYFYSGIFPLFANDAEAIAVLAHEAAHIVMRHDGSVGEDHPLLMADRNWPAMRKQYIETDTNLYTAMLLLRKTREGLLDARWDSIKYVSDRIEAATLNLPKELRGEIKRGESERQQKENELGQAITDLNSIRGKLNANADAETVAMYGELKAKTAILEIGLANLEERLEMDKIQLIAADKTLDEAVGEALDSYLGGILGKAWKQLKRSVDDVSEQILNIEKTRGELHRGLMVYASAKVGYDYSIYNWQEAEADQVGFEMYLRAGFDPQYFPQFDLKVIDSQRQRQLCEEKIAKAQRGESFDFPTRGRYSHPSSCWRALNISHTELKLHANAYAPLLPQAKAAVVFPGMLDQVKADLQ